MKVSCLCLSFLLAICGLHWTPTTANKIFHFGSCEILMNVNEIRTGFTAIKANIQARDTVRTTSILSFPYSLHRVNSEDTCCFIHHLLKFYVDMVFKHCETEDSWVNRKISSIANSFLSIKKNFRHCCEINMHFHELRHNFAAVKEMLQSQDKNTDVRFLPKSYSLQDIEPVDRCCFLRHLMRFYLANVFKHCEESSFLVKRKVSSIANNFLHIKRDLRLCHDAGMCHCTEDVKQKYTRILSRFEEMDIQSAAIKALGELDILLDWMDKTD
ncbi:interleukin-20-like [Alligator sinensis]|uniref:Interleukin family protein n=1 Tax=Alligator sinensis TaxID=38654 RepID=A0A1U7S3B0_ALLSI|nr:interleukin-20-like [Alligator sinensis]